MEDDKPRPNDYVFEARERVVDERTFLEFLNVLATDFKHEEEIAKTRPPTFYLENAPGWENGRIDTFLDAAAAWAEDVQSRTDNPWRRCADILLAGKFYE